MKRLRVGSAAPLVLAMGAALAAPSWVCAKDPIEVQAFKGKVKRNADVVSINVAMAEYQSAPASSGVFTTPLLNLTWLS